MAARLNPLHNGENQTTRDGWHWPGAGAASRSRQRGPSASGRSQRIRMRGIQRVAPYRVPTTRGRCPSTVTLGAPGGGAQGPGHIKVTRSNVATTQPGAHQCSFKHVVAVPAAARQGQIENRPPIERCVFTVRLRGVWLTGRVCAARGSTRRPSDHGRQCVPAMRKFASRRCTWFVQVSTQPCDGAAAVRCGGGRCGGGAV